VWSWIIWIHSWILKKLQSAKYGERGSVHQSETNRVQNSEPVFIPPFTWLKSMQTLQIWNQNKSGCEQTLWHESCCLLSLARLMNSRLPWCKGTAQWQFVRCEIPSSQCLVHYTQIFSPFCYVDPTMFIIMVYRLLIQWTAELINTINQEKKSMLKQVFKNFCTISLLKKCFGYNTIGISNGLTCTVCTNGLTNPNSYSF